MNKLTLKKEIENKISDALYELSQYPENHNEERLTKSIMKIINKKAKKIDIGEMIKTLMWENKGKCSLNYGDIAEYIEKKIEEAFK